MTWHRSDDGFPEHPKSDALAEHFGDDWATCAVAFMAWHHMGCDCAARRTDGVFNASRARRVVRAPAEVVDRALAALVKVGFLDKHRDGFVFHDWAEYQPTRAELDAERAAKTERQKRWRENRPKNRDAVDGRVDASTTASETRDGSVGRRVGDGGVDGAPSRPDPSPSEGSKEPLSGAPSAAPTGAPLELTPPKAKAARAKRPVAPKPAKPAAPFTAGEAVAALAAASGGRFVPADGTPWAPGWGANIARHVQAVPDLAVWTLVGEWIAAGGGYRGTRGMPWVAGGSFLDAVAQSKAWDEGGRYDLVDERGFPVAPPASCSDASDPWVIAAAKQGIKL